MSEVFRPVVGYEGIYEVSNLGSVRSLERWVRKKGDELLPERMMKAHKTASGYYAVCLRKDKQRKTHNVHTLVLTAFVGPRPDGYEACHADGNRANNRLSNLKWGTKRENTEDRERHGSNLCGEKNKHAKLTDAAVYEILRYKNNSTQKKLAERYGVSVSVINKIIVGKTWKHIAR